MSKILLILWLWNPELSIAESYELTAPNFTLSLCVRISREIAPTIFAADCVTITES